MKKFLFLALVALVACAGVASAQANLGDNFAGQIPLKFTRTAPSAVTYGYQMTYTDSVSIGAFADSVRTSNINTDGWDWSGFNAMASATVVRPIADVVFYIPNAYTNGAVGDTIYYVVEPSFDGGQTYISSGCGAGTGNGFPTPGLGNFAVATTELPGVYRGHLAADMDGSHTLASNQYYVWGYRDFRLKLFGDSSGAVIGPVRAVVYPVTSKFVR